MGPPQTEPIQAAAPPVRPTILEQKIIEILGISCEMTGSYSNIRLSTDDPDFPFLTLTRRDGQEVIATIRQGINGSTVIDTFIVTARTASENSSDDTNLCDIIRLAIETAIMGR
jgi:hypothetical protein